MATIYGPINPPNAATYQGSSQLGGTHVGADGDIFVRTGGAFPQWRFSVNPTPSWTQVIPPVAGSPRTIASDTRADVAPPGGQLNDRLAKLSGQPWDIGWRNAADSIVRQFDRAAALVWNLEHQLGHRWVDVTVISPGQTDPTAPQKTITPEIEYTTEMECSLTFFEPTAGTAIIRR